MPASLPGSTVAQNKANPTLGKFVLFDALSGPKGSPLDVRIITGYDPVTRMPIYANDAANQNPSTGALSTGIGFGAQPIINVNAGLNPATPVNAIKKAGFDDDEGPTPGANSTIAYIGGGRSNANVNGVAATNPYVAGFQISGAGEGGSRDGGAGPAFTGFPIKMVTATGAVAPGAAIEAGFVNRTGIAMVATESAHGSDAAAQAAPA
jgi:hypothetical protein